MEYVLLIIGFILLVKGADYFVDGSSSVASLLKVPPLIIGLTIVSAGTSAPEAAVSITAAANGIGGLSVGNVVGSNIFNLLVVIGASALIAPFKTDKDILRRDLPINLIISVLLLIFVFNGILGRVEGVVLFLLMIAYMVYLIIDSIKHKAEAEDVETMSPIKSVIFIIGGLAAIIWGGDLVVDAATAIAKTFGLSDTLIGLTIVAVGTSLPELVTSVVAARKGQSELSLGNAVGSCIFNILFILGISSVIIPQTIDPQLIINSVILIAVSAFLWFVGKTKGNITRVEGVVCVLAYVAYTAYLILSI